VGVTLTIVNTGAAGVVSTDIDGEETDEPARPYPVE
jgi:hypothetical protein